MTREVTRLTLDLLNPDSQSFDNTWYQNTLRERVGVHAKELYGFVWWVILLQVIVPIVVRLILDWWLNRDDPAARRELLVLQQGIAQRLNPPRAGEL